MSTTNVSRRLLIQSVEGVEEIIRRDIAAIHALAIDAAAVNGGGTNEPTGIIGNTSVSVSALGTNGAVPTYAAIINLARDLAVANANGSSAAFLTTPGVAAELMKTQTFATTNGQPVWAGSFEDGRLGNGGWRAVATNQVPSNLTKGTSTTVCHAIIAGQFSELLVGEWGALEVIVDPYTLAKRNMISLTSLQMVDVGLRHTASFKIIKDALVT